jgi:hypothetical protein
MLIKFLLGDKDISSEKTTKEEFRLSRKEKKLFYEFAKEAMTIAYEHDKTGYYKYIASSCFKYAKAMILEGRKYK